MLPLPFLPPLFLCRVDHGGEGGGEEGRWRAVNNPWRGRREAAAEQGRSGGATTLRSLAARANGVRAQGGWRRRRRAAGRETVAAGKPGKAGSSPWGRGVPRAEERGRSVQMLRCLSKVKTENKNCLASPPSPAPSATRGAESGRGAPDPAGTPALGFGSTYLVGRPARLLPRRQRHSVSRCRFGCRQRFPLISLVSQM